MQDSMLHANLEITCFDIVFSVSLNRSRMKIVEVMTVRTHGTVQGAHSDSQLQQLHCDIFSMHVTYLSPADSCGLHD